MRGSKVLIEHTSAQISDGHKVGIIGRNGCGKSSLFAAILGDLAPELGSIGVPKNIKTKDELKQYLCQLNLKK